MNFDSVIFISCFLPVLAALYWVIPGIRGKNALLLIFSLVFYCFAGFSALFLLLGLTLVNYLLGVWIRSGRGAKIATVIGVTLNVAFLGFFKYLNFLLSQVLGLPAISLGLAVPLGISFFVFKSISYLMDIRRDPTTASTSFFRFLLYVSFFPQIVTGPITRFRDFAPQLTARTHSLQTAATGMKRFILGMGKKLILSGILGTMVDSIYALPESVLTAPLAWLGAVGYCLQLFFDFSGYTDMAIGLGGFFGFTTIENFNRPYVAVTIGDFWRRWHISLSTWFRDYVYIPLGGNRKGSLRTGINKSIVFILCGLWHGASWTFLLWGIWHGVFSLLESTGVIPAKKLEKHRFLGHVYALLVVLIGFVMFRAGTVSQGLSFLRAMFTGFSASTAATVALHQVLSVEAAAMLVLGVLFCLPTPACLVKSKLWQPLSYVASLLLLLLCIIALAAGGFAPSIYAGF